MRKSLKRQTLFAILTCFLIITAKASDSDFVDCNRAWKIAILGSSTTYVTGTFSDYSSWAGELDA